MPGASCAIFGSSTFQKHKIATFKVPTKYDEYSKKTGGKTVDAIFRGRVIVKGLQSQINKRTLFAYEGYYLVCKMLHHKCNVCVFKFSSLH